MCYEVLLTGVYIRQMSIARMANTKALKVHCIRSRLTPRETLIQTPVQTSPTKRNNKKIFFGDLLR